MSETHKLAAIWSPTSSDKAGLPAPMRRRGKLSHHALNDRYKGCAKSGARQPACFSRIVPAVLESTLA